MNRFHNSMIYGILSENGEDLYVGSSYSELEFRMDGHRNNYTAYLKSPETKSNNTSYLIICNAGYDYFVIESICCENALELSQHEEFYINYFRELEVFNVVNKNNPHRTEEQEKTYQTKYALDHRESRKAYYANYNKNLSDYRKTWTDLLPIVNNYFE